MRVCRIRLRPLSNRDSCPWRGSWLLARDAADQLARVGWRRVGGPDHVLIRADQDQPRLVLLAAAVVTVPNHLQRYIALQGSLLQRAQPVLSVESQQREAVAQFLE